MSIPALSLTAKLVRFAPICGLAGGGPEVYPRRVGTRARGPGPTVAY